MADPPGGLATVVCLPPCHVGQGTQGDVAALCLTRPTDSLVSGLLGPPPQSPTTAGLLIAVSVTSCPLCASLSVGMPWPPPRSVLHSQ